MEIWEKSIETWNQKNIVFHKENLICDDHKLFAFITPKEDFSNTTSIVDLRNKHHIIS